MPDQQEIPQAWVPSGQKGILEGRESRFLFCIIHESNPNADLLLRRISLGYHNLLGHNRHYQHM